MVVDVPGVGPVDMDPADAIQLADDIYEQLPAEIPRTIRAEQYSREDPETGQALPSYVEGYDPDLHHPLDPTVKSASQWPELNRRVDPDRRTDVPHQERAR